MIGKPNNYRWDQENQRALTYSYISETSREIEENQLEKYILFKLIFDIFY